MKTKIFAFLLALVMLLSITACVKKNDEGGFNIGYINDLFSNDAFVEHNDNAHSEENLEAPAERLIYSNLSAALLAMENEKITSVAVSKSTADYVAAHNDKFQSTALTKGEDLSHYSMMTTDTNTEIYDILNSGIKQLKENGTLAKLIEEDLKAYIASDPTPAELPKFEGAKTYKIAVTGDLPPMDFVTVDGKAAGFNVALLTEIANIAQVNFEIVQIDSGARLTALVSGTVDAVFWMEASGCMFCGDIFGSAPQGTVITEAYFSDAPAFLTLK
jgi:polar amino acid transport system substrate-binding protein